MTTEDQTVEIASVEELVTDIAAFGPTDPIERLEGTSKIVKYMAEQCSGSKFIAPIQGKQYPKVEWWTTVGYGLSLSPQLEWDKRLDREGEIAYEAMVVVTHMPTGRVVARASAICSSKEKSWGNRDEYAIKSMAQTRATGKAYRIPLSFLAVMAGIEPTPADEIPPQGFDNRKDEGYGICPVHNIAFFQSGRMNQPAHKPVERGGRWCNKADVEKQQPEPPAADEAPQHLPVGAAEEPEGEPPEARQR